MTGGKRAKSGRKPIKIDQAELEKLCALQCTDVEIASFFGITPRTLERRKKQAAFAEVMDRGKARGKTSLRRSLFGLAMKGNPAANIFLAKNLLGYKDYFANELSGPDGGAIPIGPAPELSGLSDEDLTKLATVVNEIGRPLKG
jgi:hypothetical protein